MPQSLSQIILHLVFSTKERHPWIDTRIRPGLHAYLATICRDCGSGCEAYRVGGVKDHVHIALRLGRTTTAAAVIEKIKKSSSSWMKQQGREYADFFWQSGYGAFSVGMSQLDDLLAYIEHQEQHHCSRSFQEEYRRLLRRYQVQFEEKYLWD